MAKQKEVSLGPLKYANSAGRLLRLLSSREGEAPIAPHFAKVFFPGHESLTDAAKRRAYTRAMVKAQELYEEFVADLQRAEMLDVQRALLATSLQGLGGLFYLDNLGSNTRSLSETERSLLELSATFIPPEGQFEESDAEKIRAGIEELRAQLNRADLNPTLKKMLQELIRLSTECIDRANTEGVRGLKKSFKEMLGEVMDRYTHSTKEEKEDGAWQTVQRQIVVVDEIVGRLAKYQPMLEYTVGAVAGLLGSS